MSKYDWSSTPRRYLKTEMAKQGITIVELANRLEKLGVPETRVTVTKKLSRGTFSAIFLFQCLKAMDIDHLALTDDFLKQIGAKNEEST